MFHFDDTRYSAFPLFLTCVLFVLLAPVFWLRVELPQGAVASRPYENTRLYERTYPNLDYGFARLRAGELPLWNPYQFCGVPFQADPASGLFQPLHLIFLLTGTARGMATLAFVCLFMMGAGFALFLRGLRVRYVSACFGGVVYAFGGASAAAMSRPELAVPLAWLPLAFWAVREYSEHRRFAVLIPGAFATAFSLLSGGFVLTLVMLLLLLPYALLCAFSANGGGWRGRGRDGMAVLLVVVLGLGISCVQWWPALLWAGTLAEPGTALWPFDVAGRLPGDLPSLLAQVLGAKAGVEPRPGYVGIATLLVLPAALFHRTARREVIYFGSCAVLALAALLWPLVPFQGFPTGVWLYPAVFALSVLAGLGADRMLTVTRDPRSPFVWIPVLLLLIIAGGILYAGTAYVRGLLLLNLVLLLPFLLIRTRWLSLMTGVVLSAALFVDCCLASVNYSPHPFVDGPSLASEPAALLREAEERALHARLFQVAPGRVMRLPANLGMLAQLPMAGGASLPLSRDQQAWWDSLGPLLQGLDVTEDGGTAWHPSLLNYMAARVLLVDEEAAFGIGRLEREGVRLEFYRSRDQMRLYTNESDSVLPRAYWVPAWRRVEDVAAAVGMITAPGFEPKTTCAISGSVSGLEDLQLQIPEAAAATGETGAAVSETSAPVPEVVVATIQVSQPERVAVQAEAPQAGLLVLSDTFAPGWTATVDGVPAVIRQVNGIFRAVAVPAGPHLVVFQYAPPAFWQGLAVSIGTIVLTLLAGCYRLWRR